MVAAARGAPPEHIAKHLPLSAESAPLFRESKDVGRQELAFPPGDEGHLHHITFTKEDASDILVDGQYLAEARVEVDPVGLTRQPHGEAFSLFPYDPVGCLESHMATALSFHHQQLSPGILDASL